MTPVHVLTPLEAATLAVHDINHALKIISGDVALLIRLKAAEEAQKALTAKLASAHEALAIATAKDAAAKRAELHGRFGEVSIVAIADPRSNGSALACKYEITYETMEYDGRTTNLVTKRAAGFSGLPNGLYDYIIDVKPHKLPSVLLSLANDPATAMAIYFKALAKGYLEG